MSILPCLLVVLSLPTPAQKANDKTDGPSKPLQAEHPQLREAIQHDPRVLALVQQITEIKGKIAAYERVAASVEADPTFQALRNQLARQEKALTALRGRLRNEHGQLLQERGRGQRLPTAKPEQVGMSSKRLARIRPAMQQLVDEGRVPGVITLISRRGKVVHFEQVGFRDIENKRPMQPDTILRFYSQTKPVTGIAVMILYEEGEFLLSDPVSKYLPEFKDMKVLTENGLTKATNPITIKHLLTHTAGLTYWMVPGWEREFEEVGELYIKAGLAPHETDTQSLEDWTKRLAQQPLVAEPGTLWHYSVAMDVLGRLVEVWSGKCFDQFLHDRIFEPLSMHDTAFLVPDDRLDRFAVNYGKGKDGKLDVVDSVEESRFRKMPKVCLGGSGLVSTAPDYFRFSQMLLNGGELEGVRILGPRTVKLMMRDHLPSTLGPNPLASVFGGDPDTGDRGKGFGFTGSVVVNAAHANSPISEGSFSWGGAASTVFWVDPQEELVVLVLSQLMMGAEKLDERMAPLTYQAIID